MIRKPLIPYEEIGAEKLSELIDLFYSKVAVHPDLYPIFPDDLTETARKQKQFMTQYLGGPNLYSEEHGHPMMKARHNAISNYTDYERRHGFHACQKRWMKSDSKEKYVNFTLNVSS